MKIERLGTTFSQVQCGYFNMPLKQAYSEVCSLEPDILRLATYWDEIETSGFGVTDYLVETADKLGIPLVLTVGVKSPRYKEFWFPDRVEKRLKSDWKVFGNEKWQVDETLKHTRKVIERYREIPSLQYFQVENEAGNRLWVTHGRSVNQHLLKEEVALVKKLKNPAQKILLSTSIEHTNPFSVNDWVNFFRSIKLADAVGVNIYDKMAASRIYLEQNFLYRKKLRIWSSLLNKYGIEAWATEIQGEPWEREGLVCIKNKSYPSSTPEQAEQLMANVKEDGFKTRLWWGVEHGIWHKLQGNNEWVDMWNRLKSAA